MGELTITSHRVVFTGNRSIEMPYKKLLSLEVFEDGIKFHLSNRKDPILFKLGQAYADAAAAVAGASCQHHLAQSRTPRSSNRTKALPLDAAS